VTAGFLVKNVKTQFFQTNFPSQNFAFDNFQSIINQSTQWHRGRGQARRQPQRDLGKHSRRALQTLSQSPAGKTIFEFFFSKRCILVYFIFLSDGGPPKRLGAAYSLPHLLNGPGGEGNPPNFGLRGNSQKILFLLEILGLKIQNLVLTSTNWNTDH